MTDNNPTTEPLHKIRLARPTHIDARVKGMGAYLAERFRKNNHTKYHRYCDEWICNITAEQLRYFIEERRRIESGVVLR